MFAERWTIDEVADGAVRVLAARSLDAESVAPMASRSSVPSAPVLEAANRAEVMAVELGSTPAIESPAPAAGEAPGWTEEQDSVLELAAVVAFLAAFRDPGPESEPRPLREGDVFWVVATDTPALALSDGPVRRSETDAVLAGYGAVGSVVHDMTAPARQASKVLYHEAFGKDEEQP